jgi:indolepyruvate ferredoxin oxidoreductase beta subunit
MEKFNIIITGTGGQGIVLLTRVLGNAAIKARLSVRVGEIHGVSQRGGSVLSFVRMGERVFSPTVPVGTGDVLIGLEPAEALRSLKYMSPKGLLLLNTRPILPNTVKTGRAQYPALEDILRIARRAAARVVPVDAARIAADAAASGAQNMLMLGILAGFCSAPVSERIFKEAIEEMVHRTFVRASLAAFDQGKVIAAEILREGNDRRESEL